MPHPDPRGPLGTRLNIKIPGEMLTLDLKSR
jgi:hypothetical protein